MKFNPKKELFLFGFISNGQLNYCDPNRVKEGIAGLEGKTVIVYIIPEDKDRSIKQNAYYWANVINPIQQFLLENFGEKHSKQDIHDYNCNLFCSVKMKSKTFLGELITTIDDKRSSAMTISEFSEFQEKVEQHWAEKGVVFCAAL